MATDPGASWVFVTDNLKIHCSETLVQVVAKACEITTTLGKKGVCGVLKSVASRQAFLSEPSHRILLRVHAEAQFVAEPDRRGLWGDHAESDSPGFVHICERFA